MEKQTPFTTFQKINLFAVWAALSSSCFIYPIFLDDGIPLQFNDQRLRFHFAVLMSLASLSIATIIRWLVIPNLKRYHRILVFFIAGLAFTEATVFYGIFLLDDQHLNEKALTFWLAILSMIQFFPPLLTASKPPPIIKQFD